MSQGSVSAVVSLAPEPRPDLLQLVGLLRLSSVEEGLVHDDAGMLERISDRRLRRLGHRIRRATMRGENRAAKLRLVRRVVGLADAETIENLADELDAADAVGAIVDSSIS